MQVEMLTLYASPDRTIQVGQRAVFPPEEAKELIDGGFARAVDEHATRTRPAVPAANRARRGGKAESESAG
ncbi:hypothetical protein [Streptosporangium sp. KLBMP 9127]|nr:hypothetical protein [Streptosporangium sp. KLBMP 9127]